MTPKFNANELHRLTAENEFVANAHVEEDEIFQNKNSLTEKYLRNQQESLELWTKSMIQFVDAQHFLVLILIQLLSKLGCGTFVSKCILTY